MTDAELICTWMMPKPTSWFGSGRWWYKAQGTQPGEEYRWVPADLTLNDIWLVEERLKTEARNLDNPNLHVRLNLYIDALATRQDGLWHSTPEQKICALAFVLRLQVEAKV